MIGVLAIVLALASASPTPDVATHMTSQRRAQEAVFMRSVNRHLSAEDMTANVLAHTGEHVAYTCEIEEIERPGIAVGQCGPVAEPVDLYLKLPPGPWRVHQKLRVLGILDAPASWSDVSGHTIYYPFVKAVFVDRIR